MLLDLLNILPLTLTTLGVVLCIAGLVVGGALWLTGANWSRWVVTLMAVAVGGTAGMLLPRWYLWPVNSMSTAVLGAVLLGVLAFIGHRVFAGLTLGGVLVAWAVLAVWVGLRADATLAPRQAWELEQMTVPQYAQDLWQRLPPPVARVVPYAAATAMVSGLCVTLLWPRVGRTLMGASLGVTLLVACGLTLVRAQRPAWLAHVPMEIPVQAGVLAGLTLVGALAQWQLLPSKKHIDRVEQERQEMQKPVRRYGELGAVLATDVSAAGQREG
jgi:hypothetical protein